MERFSGALLVLAGVALGTYSLLPLVSDTADHSEATSIAATSDHEVRLMASPTVVPMAAAKRADGAATPNSVRVFSPNAPLVTALPGASGASTTTWSAVVTSERPSNFKSAKAADSEARAHLTSDLQRELKRVGCYGGELNGAWTQSTRRAMAAFMERVNATLPANEPDYILLTLVQGHSTLVCSTDCPTGQVYNNDGRCLPAAVVAQANRRTQRLDERMAQRRELEQRKAAQQEQLAAEQRAIEARRVRIAQRGEAERLAAQRDLEQRKAAQLRFEVDKNDDRKAAKPKSGQIASAKPEQLPWLAGTSDQRHTASSATTGERLSPPPGMMSVGGPRTADAPTPATGAIAGASSATWATATVSRDTVANDTLLNERGYTLTAQAPRPAVRPAPPIREAALVEGLPGTKAGASARETDDAGQARMAYDRPAKITRRPAPYYGAPRVKRKYYAYNAGGKTRRGQPRAGTPRYNLMLSLGGIY